ncbi:MAG TPA: substrate-binding domain-containing protein [Spirochaetia bacterium]|nr:substrate-binding domain-containing protein [Spirochaetia bacterium]
MANLTIRDVAKEANVSVATVSRVLNGRVGYTEETKARVLEVIDRLEFRRNALATGLVSRRTSTIGVLLPRVSDRCSTLLLHGIEDGAHELSHSVIVCNTDDDDSRTLHDLRVLGEHQADGVIFAGSNLTDECGRELERMGIPAVLVSTSSTRYQLPYVRVDDTAAAFHAARYLVENGHRIIGMIAGPQKDPISGVTRVEGFLRALREEGLDAGGERVAYGDLRFKSGLDAMDRLMAQVRGITAVFAASDEMAVGAIAWCGAHQIRVPEQMSVIGYNDTPDAEMATPPLTTVRQPIYEMGKRAVKILVDRRHRQESLVMPFNIVERASVRRCA